LVSGVNVATIVVWGDSSNEVFPPRGGVNLPWSFKDDSRRVETRLLPSKCALLGFILWRRWIRTSSESKVHGLCRRSHWEHKSWPSLARDARSHLILRRKQKSHDSRSSPRFNDIGVGWQQAPYKHSVAESTRADSRGGIWADGIGDRRGEVEFRALFCHGSSVGLSRRFPATNQAKPTAAPRGAKRATSQLCLPFFCY
jgi:hypothetical protein